MTLITKTSDQTRQSGHTTLRMYVVRVRVIYRSTNIRGCQSDTRSQRNTKVNGPHHGDSTLIKPKGI